MPSLTIENYVKAIYQLTHGCGESNAATGKLAAALQVTPSTASNMVKTLGDSGLVQYLPYEGAQLTPQGLTLALRVLRRHRLIELFLVRTLGLTWDEVHAEAEHMEHAVSDLLIDRIDALLGYPDSDPHGDPIPKADGTMVAAEGTVLAELPVGQRFRLVRVRDQASDFLRYLSEQGLELGSGGNVAAVELPAGIIKLQLTDREVTLALSAAAKLLVERLEM